VKRYLIFYKTNEHGVDELGLAVVLAADAVPTTVAESIRKACEAALGIALAPKAIYVVTELPLNESGKEARATVRDMCAQLFRY
jgi:acyl-coenzyme A synthetase/AMP-(fatty) acid ligase